MNTNLHKTLKQILTLHSNSSRLLVVLGSSFCFLVLEITVINQQNSAGIPVPSQNSLANFQMQISLRLYTSFWKKCLSVTMKRTYVTPVFHWSACLDPSFLSLWSWHQITTEHFVSIVFPSLLKEAWLSIYTILVMLCYALSAELQLSVLQPSLSHFCTLFQNFAVNIYFS